MGLIFHQSYAKCLVLVFDLHLGIPAAAAHRDNGRGREITDNEPIPAAEMLGPLRYHFRVLHIQALSDESTTFLPGLVWWLLMVHLVETLVLIFIPASVLEIPRGCPWGGRTLGGIPSIPDPPNPLSLQVSFPGTDTSRGSGVPWSGGG